MDIIFIRGRKFGKNVNFDALKRVYTDLNVNEFLTAGGEVWDTLVSESPDFKDELYKELHNGMGQTTDNFEKLETTAEQVIKKSGRKNRRGNTGTDQIKII